MRSPIDYIQQRVGGFKIREVARRCVPCYKYVIEPDGQRLGLCMLIDHYKLYRFPYEDPKALFGMSREAVGMRGLELKAGFLRGEMEHLRLRELLPEQRRGFVTRESGRKFIEAEKENFRQFHSVGARFFRHLRHRLAQSRLKFVRLHRRHRRR